METFSDLDGFGGGGCSSRLIVAVDETVVDDDEGTSKTGAGVNAGGVLVCVRRFISDSAFTIVFKTLHLCRMSEAVPVVFLYDTILLHDKHFAKFCRMSR